MLFRWIYPIRAAVHTILNKIRYSLQARNHFLFIPKNKNASGGKVSSNTSRRGSLTVESALVLPLYFLCICTMICYMDIYRLQTEKLTGLCEKAKETAMYAYALNEREDITLPTVYHYRPPIGVVPLPALVMTNRIRIHPWTGYQRGAAGEPAVEMVYVTETGGVYHSDSGCSYLRLSIRQAPGAQVGELRNASGGRYYPCEKCAGDQPPKGVVFVTGEGTRYHSQVNCSGLKRTVRLVKKSEYANLPMCSRCAGH